MRILEAVDSLKFLCKSYAKTTKAYREQAMRLEAICVTPEVYLTLGASVLTNR